MKNKSLRIYIAGAWSRRDELEKIAADLEVTVPGIEITSRWLHEPTVFGNKVARNDAFRRRRAIEDLHDVRKATVLVRFTDDLSSSFVPSKLATGSRMFEMGVAYERGNRVVVVGGHQPIFDYLPKIVHARHLDELRTYLRGLVGRNVPKRKRGRK